VPFAWRWRREDLVSGRAESARTALNAIARTGRCTSLRQLTTIRDGRRAQGGLGSSDGGTPPASGKVPSNFFLLGLSAVEAEAARNLKLMSEQPWFDIPVVYNNGRRAIVAVEKGASGERAFAEAFNWAVPRCHDHGCRLSIIEWR
jgi:hypothetical protein